MNAITSFKIVYLAAYAKQINLVRPKFVIVDSFTVDNLKAALKQYDQDVQLISVGVNKVPGTIHYSELLEDDGSGTLIYNKIMFCLIFLYYKI